MGCNIESNHYYLSISYHCISGYSRPVGFILLESSMNLYYTYNRRSICKFDLISWWFDELDNKIRNKGRDFDTKLLSHCPQQLHQGQHLRWYGPERPQHCHHFLRGSNQKCPATPVGPGREGGLGRGAHCLLWDKEGTGGDGQKADQLRQICGNDHREADPEAERVCERPCAKECGRPSEYTVFPILYKTCLIFSIHPQRGSFIRKNKKYSNCNWDFGWGYMKLVIVAITWFVQTKLKEMSSQMPKSIARV